MISVNAHTQEKIGSGGRGTYPYNRACKLTVREKLLQHRQHSCPGNIGHKQRSDWIQNRIFERYYQAGHKAYVMYWRSHKDQFNAMKEYFENA